MPIQIDTTKKGAIAQFIKDKVEAGATIYIPSSIFTIFAFNELKDIIKKSNKVKFLFNKPTFIKKVRTDEKNVKEFTLEMSNREKNVSEFALEIAMKNSMDQNILQMNATWYLLTKWKCVQLRKIISSTQMESSLTMKQGIVMSSKV